MSKRWIVLVTNKEGLDTLCKNKIFVGLIQNKLISGSMIDDVAGGIYWISIDLPPVKRTRFIIEELSTIYDRWQKYDTTGELDWWLEKSPNFYLGE